MRPIKFRAYHKQEKKMYPVWGTLHNLVALSHSGDALSFTDIDEVELMQFTGLYDKNGKEVYEGDIIRCYTGRGNDEYWYSKTVVWTTDRCNCGFLLGSGGKIEIIGNIYEHPELVRQEEQEA